MMRKPGGEGLCFAPVFLFLPFFLLNFGKGQLPSRGERGLWSWAIVAMIAANQLRTETFRIDEMFTLPLLS